MLPNKIVNWIDNIEKPIICVHGVRPEHLVLDGVVHSGPEEWKRDGEHTDGQAEEEQAVEQVHDQPWHQQPPAATHTRNNLQTSKSYKKI